MGCVFSTNEKVQPETKIENSTNSIKKSTNSERAAIEDEERRVTDVPFLIIFLASLVLYYCAIGYCVENGNIMRIVKGYDNCGNICGEKLTFPNNISVVGNCSESNLDKPYFLKIRRNNTRVKDRYCVKNCTNYEGYYNFLNRCIRNNTKKLVSKILSKTESITNFFQEVSHDFHLCYEQIIYLCLISLGLSVLMLILFRYLVGYVVWLILIGVMISSLAISICLWISWKRTKSETETINLELVEYRKRDTYLIFAIISTILTVIVFVIIFFLRKSIQIVIQLFQESAKALAAIPWLITVPILTFLALCIFMSVSIFLSVYIESSGIHKKENDVFQYTKDDLMIFTRWYHVLIIFWKIQIIIGLQHMIIAGAVSKWYFTRDKSKLGNCSILKTTLYNLFRFHLGSVALGSLVIAVVQVARVILKFIGTKLSGREGNCARYSLKICQCCLCCFEKILKYLTRNAYIEISMHGCSFCEGGKKAFRLLVENALRVKAINSVGDFILFLAKVKIVTATVFIGIRMLDEIKGLQHMWVPVTLSGLFAYFIAHCFMTVYEMIIDTIFLCFCEDCEQNDGISKPYFMSRGLMTFVENSNKPLDQKEKGAKSEENSANNLQS